jgi:cell division protein FtsN
MDRIMNVEKFEAAILEAKRQDAELKEQREKQPKKQTRKLHYREVNGSYIYCYGGIYDDIYGGSRQDTEETQPKETQPKETQPKETQPKETQEPKPIKQTHKLNYRVVNGCTLYYYGGMYGGR